MEGKKTQKDIKDCCTTKLDGIEQLKTKAIELKYLKDKEECIDAWERWLTHKLEMLKDQLAML